MQMITTQENTRNSMRNLMRTTMPPFVNVDGSNESVQSVDSNNDLIIVFCIKWSWTVQVPWNDML